MTNGPETAGTRAVRRPAGAQVRSSLVAAIVVAAGMGGGMSIFAASTEIAGAVIASGQLVVETASQKVQHQTGGIVGQLMVREGQRVVAGQVLLRLDETLLRANRDIIAKSLDELAARQARLEAERDGLEDVSFPRSLTARSGEPDIERLVGSERHLHRLRREARDGQKRQLSERIVQLHEEIRGIEAQVRAKAEEMNFLQRELGGVRDLYERRLVQLPRLTALEREYARLGGEHGALVAQVARARGRISEIGMQILQIDSDLRSEVAKELREIQARSAELIERRIASEDQLARVEVRAPHGGVVHHLTVHTVGGVVAPGEQMMTIVPDGDPLVVESRVMPQDIDNVRLGQAAVLRFSAFNQHTTPELAGTVSLISADLTTDPRTGMGFYTARISVEPAEMSRLGAVRLLPGMPVEAFIQTGTRSVLSHLMKPLTDQIGRAFRQS